MLMQAPIWPDLKSNRRREREMHRVNSATSDAIPTLCRLGKHQDILPDDRCLEKTQEAMLA